MNTPMNFAPTCKRLWWAAGLLFVLAGAARAQDVDATAMIRGGLEVIQMIDAGNTIDELCLALHATDFFMYRRLYALHRAFFAEPSPAPIKAALAMKGLMQPSVRLPLVEASEACKAQLSQLMKAFEAA